MKSKTVKIVALVLLVATLAFPGTSHAWRGWWGPGFFAGGVLLGAALAHPWYAPPPVYVYPPPGVVYAPPPPEPVYVYPSPPVSSGTVPSPQGKGQWVEVPGQMVNNVWVPPHRVWVAEGQ